MTTKASHGRKIGSHRSATSTAGGVYGNRADTRVAGGSTVVRIARTAADIDLRSHRLIHPKRETETHANPKPDASTHEIAKATNKRMHAATATNVCGHTNETVCLSLSRCRVGTLI